MRFKLRVEVGDNEIQTCIYAHGIGRIFSRQGSIVDFPEVGLNSSRLVEYENKLNQLEKEKEQLRDKMVQKTNLLVFQLDRQDQYIRRENILLYGVEENKEDNDDGKRFCSK